MMNRKMTTACLVAGALLATVPGVANAETSQEQLHAKVAQLEAKLAQIEADQRGDWTSEARRAEIEGMIADVFADAENRATLLQEGALAGIDEKGKIFLMSSDGSFTANLFGQIQARYIYNTVDDRADESLSGFQMRRTKLGVQGKVGDGWGYKLRFQVTRSTANATADDVYITKDLGDGWKVLVGSAKLPFARQELVSASRQVAADRTLVNEFFTLNRSDQVQLRHSAGDFKYAIALSDGGNANYSAFATDVSNDFAVTGRIDWMAIGDDWKDMKHEFGGVDEDALFLGAAVHYEKADRTAEPESGVAWTVDALYKTGPVALTAAVFGNHTDDTASADTDQFGVYVQGDVDLGDGWDVFARWEHIDDDDNAGAGTEELEAITFGVNKHFNKNVKFTGDVVWIYAGDNPASDGNFINGGELSSSLGLSSTGFSDAEDQIALRLQLQLLF